MTTSDHIVFVIDDDPSVCKSLARLLGTAGHATETFESIAHFMSRAFYSGPGCFLLDVCLPEMSGLEATQKLSEAGYYLPTVFISGYDDVSQRPDEQADRSALGCGTQDDQSASRTRHAEDADENGGRSGARRPESRD